jgi:mannitol-1-/sugar-/sorbitol-6-phosphatase
MMPAASQRIFRCAAILFDLDGVLVDSTRSVARQWALWAAEHNVPPEEAVRVAHGRRTLETIRLLAPHLDAEAETLRLERREADDTDGVGRIPGALELLQSLPSQRWAVVTSGTRYLATRRLQTNGLPSPAAFVTADEVSQGKPHPEPYLKGAELLRVPARECVVFEDAPAGLESAQAAGMAAIALSTTYPAAALARADAVVSDFSRVRVLSDGAGRLEIFLGKS